MDSLLGGRFRLGRELGRGGFGAVYEAEDVGAPGRLVALKVLERPAHDAASFEARFMREVKNAQRLDHPHAIKVHEYGALPDGRLYYAMELCVGRSLRAVLAERGPLEPARAVRLVCQVLSALGAAHALGMVHRDMKLDNVQVVAGPDGREQAKLLDFGLAKVRGGRASQDLTAAGRVFGTLEYMAPEHVMGKPLDGRADLYAAGVALFELLAGRRPFEERDDKTLVRAILGAPPPDLRAITGGRVGAALAAAIAKSLVKAPADRHESAEAMARALLDAEPGAASDAVAVVVPTPAPAAAPDAQAGSMPETRAAVSTIPPTRAAEPTIPPTRVAAPAIPPTRASISNLPPTRVRAAEVPPPTRLAASTVLPTRVQPPPVVPETRVQPVAPPPAPAAGPEPAPAPEPDAQPARAPEPASAPPPARHARPDAVGAAVEEVTPTRVLGAAPPPARDLSYDGSLPLGGRYALRRPPHESRHGRLYEAYDLEAGRPVGLKVLDGRGAVSEPDMRRYVRGLEALARVVHPNVVRFLDAGVSPAGAPYFVMEWVPGLPIRHYLKRGAVPLPEAAGALCQSLEGLEAAHAAGILHRDVTPDHLLVVPTDAGAVVKLFGFGIARSVLGDDGTVTRWGQAIGTPRYMSPEQLMGKPLDARADVWSAGTVLFEMLAGRSAYPEKGLTEVVVAVLRQPTPSLPPDVSAETRAAIDPTLARALAKDLDARFATARAFREALLPLAGPFAVADQAGLGGAP